MQLYPLVIKSVKSCFILLEFSEGNNLWEDVNIPLDDYAGKRIFIRFDFISQMLFPMVSLSIDDISPVGWFEEISEIENIPELQYNMANKTTGHYYYRAAAVDNEGLQGAWSNIRNILVDNTSGIDDEFGGSEISVFPNPGNGNFTLYLNSEIPSDAQMIIYNNLGETVYFESLYLPVGSFDKSIKADYLSTGNYTLILKSNDKIVSKKLIVF